MFLIIRFWYFSMEDKNREPFVLVSVFKDDAKPEQITNAAPAL